MKIRINKASEPTYWYADRIGLEFEVISSVDELERRGHYEVKLHRPYIGHFYVKEKDCEIVTEVIAIDE